MNRYKTAAIVILIIVVLLVLKNKYVHCFKSDFTAYWYINRGDMVLPSLENTINLFPKVYTKGQCVRFTKQKDDSDKVHFVTKDGYDITAAKTLLT